MVSDCNLWIFWNKAIQIDFIGVGPGSHGCYHNGESPIATIQVSSVNAWMASVRALGHGTRKAVLQSHYNSVIELLDILSNKMPILTIFEHKRLLNTFKYNDFVFE